MNMKKQFFHRFFPIILILGWTVLIAWLNRQHGVLSGWDNLHPEYNIQAYFWRTVFGVWQSNQGLGHLAGMGIASDFPRLFFIYITKIIVGFELTRFVIFLSSYFLGTAFSYFLFKELTQKRSIAITGATTYATNPITVQIFYLGFDPYIWSFWSIPFCLYFTFKYLKKPSQKQLLLLSIAFLLLSPNGYLQTNFVSFFLFYLIVVAASIQSLKKSIKFKLTLFTKVFAFLLITNLFWLVPVGYSSFYNSPVTKDAQQNILATPVVSIQNNYRGSLIDLLSLKSYWLDLEIIENKSVQYLFHPWVNHYQIYTIPSLFMYGISFIALLLIPLFFKKERYLIGFSISSICIFLLLSKDFPDVRLFVFDKLPILEQIYRSPFTKVANILSLLTSLGTTLFISKISTAIKSSYVTNFFNSLIILLSLIIIAPAFGGNFFYNRLQNELPKEYLNLASFLSGQESERLITFPNNYFWGWYDYSWGYHGSGFLWYLLDDAVIDRTFDVWSSESENFYNLYSFAIFSNNSDLFERILNVHSVRNLLWDDSIKIPNQEYKLLQKRFLTEQEKTWQSNFLELYQTDQQDITQKCVKSHTLKNYLFTNPLLNLDIDCWFDSQDPEILSPFSDLLQNRFQNLKLNNQVLNYSTQLAVSPGRYLINIENDIGIPVFISINETKMTIQIGIKSMVKLDHQEVFSSQTFVEEYELIPESQVFFKYNDIQEAITSDTYFEIPANESFEFLIQQIKNDSIVQQDQIIISYSDMYKYSETVLMIDNDQLISNIEAELTPVELRTNFREDCSPISKGSSSVHQKNSEYELLSSQFNSSCLQFLDLDQNLGTILYLPTKNNVGKNLRMSIFDQNQFVLTELLTSRESFFVIPEINSKTLTINFENRSFGEVASNNLSLTAYPNHLNNIINLTMSKLDFSTESFDLLKPVSYSHGFVYLLTPKNNIYLPQSHHPAWLAFPLSKPWQMLEHVEVNGWANGWIVPEEYQDGKTRVVILFWPQLLSFAGFILLILTFIYLLRATYLEHKRWTKSFRRVTRKVPSILRGNDS